VRKEAKAAKGVVSMIKRLIKWWRKRRGLCVECGEKMDQVLWMERCIKCHAKHDITHAMQWQPGSHQNCKDCDKWHPRDWQEPYILITPEQK
jgi:hypothetical protein